MDEKQINSSSRRYNLINNNHIDQQKKTNSNHQQLIPISIDHLSTPGIISHKRRRCSITNQPCLSTQLSSNNEDLIFDRNITMTTTTRGTRKRSAQDDMVTYTTHHFLREHEQYVRIENYFVKFDG
jgi:hypothetical protein